MRLAWRVLRGAEWVASRALIGSIRIYQGTISPLIGPACRFEPSCSRYMIAAVNQYGLIRGGVKGLRRLSRCHPWHPGGYDPP